MPLDREVLNRFHQVLVDEIRQLSPEYLAGEFTVAEIYQKLVPYGAHRARIGVEMNGDYEDALLRLLVGEGEYLTIQSEPARHRIRRELESSNPNTGIYREFAAVGVRLNPDRIPVSNSDGITRASGADATKAVPEASSPASGAPSAGPHLFEMADAEPDGEGAAPDMMSAGVGNPRQGEASTGSEVDSSLPAACPGCARDLPPRAALRFCPFCGVDVRMRECSACAESLEWGWAFCIACGTQMERA